VETHNVTLEGTLPFTYNYKTSRSAHKLLLNILLFECKKGQVTNYGLTMKPGVELKIANSKNAAFLLQAELHSIYRGNTFGKKQGLMGGRSIFISGYFD
jgi:hypothetical protein